MLISRARARNLRKQGLGGNFGGNINQSFGRNRIVQGFDTHHVVPAAAFWVGQFPGAVGFQPGSAKW